jgi:hypothetical protein
MFTMFTTLRVPQRSAQSPRSPRSPHFTSLALPAFSSDRWGGWELRHAKLVLEPLPTGKIGIEPTARHGEFGPPTRAIRYGPPPRAAEEERARGPARLGLISPERENGVQYIDGIRCPSPTQLPERPGDWTEHAEEPEIPPRLLNE